VTPFALISLIAALIPLEIGFFTFWNDRRRLTTKLFLALCLTMSLYGFVEFGYRTATSLDEALVWFRLDLFWALTAVIILHFSIAFTRGDRLALDPRVLAVLYIPLLFVLVVNLFTDLFGTGPVERYWGWSYLTVETLTPAYNLATLWAMGLIIMALVLNLLAFHDSDTPDDRHRFRLLLIYFLIVLSIIEIQS